MLGGLAGVALAAGRPLGGAPGTGWRGGRCRRRAARSSSRGSRARSRVRRDRWGVPHIEAGSARRHLVRQGFCHAQDRLWQMDFYRRVGPRAGLGDGRAGGPSGRPADADARHPARRRARGGGARPRAARACSSASARGSTPPRRAPGRCPSRCSCCASRFEPWRPVDVLSLGKLLAFGLSTNWERELLRADMVRALGPGARGQARPEPTRSATRSSPRKPWSGDGTGDRRADRRRAPHDRARGRGERLEQLGGLRQAERHRLAADRRRPAPAPEHAGHLVPGRPAGSATASSAAPRCRACPASTWARTTTSAGPSPT